MGLDNPIHLAFLAVIVLMVFGAKRLPEMGRSLGAGMRGFRESVSGEVGAAAAGGELGVAAPSAPVIVTQHDATPTASDTSPAVAPARL